MENNKINTTIALGSKTIYSLQKGDYNFIFGDNAAQNDTELSNTLVINLGGREIREKITNEEWEYLNKIVREVFNSIRENTKTELEKTLDSFPTTPEFKHD